MNKLLNLNKRPIAMGVNKYTFIGAYVEIPLNKLTVEKNLESCPNSTCKNHKVKVSTDYCPLCGSETFEITFQAIEELRVYQLIWDESLEIEDDEFHILQKPNVDYLTSNYTGIGSIAVEEEEITEITHELIQSSITNFTQKHQEDLKKINAYYKHDFKVQFGVIEYWS